MMRDQWNHADGSTVSQRRFCNSVQRCFKAETGNSVQSRRQRTRKWGITAGPENGPRYFGDYRTQEASLAGLACNEGEGGGGGGQIG